MDYNPNETIAYELWSRADVQSRCEDLEVNLTDEQCDEVLELFDDVGADVGQNWDSMDVCIYQIAEENS